MFRFPIATSLGLWRSAVCWLSRVGASGACLVEWVGDDEPVVLCACGSVFEGPELEAVLEAFTAAAAAGDAEPAIKYSSVQQQLDDLDVSGDLDLDPAVADLERKMITAALARTKGNRSKAAKLLGISRNGLALKMDRLGLT